MAVGERIKDWWTGEEQQEQVARTIKTMPPPKKQQYIGMEGTRDVRATGPQAEAAYVKALEAELGVRGTPDIRQSQYAALYDTASNVLGAAGADLRGRGIQGDLGTAAKAKIAQRELIPAAAQIEQQYADMLMKEQERRLGMAGQRGQFETGVAESNAAREAARKQAEWQMRNQIAAGNVGAENQWTQAQWEAALAAQMGQYGAADAVTGALIGAGGQVGGAFAGRPVTKVYGAKE